VRERLLERALRHAESAGAEGGLDELARDEPGAPRNPLDSELDRVALGGDSDRERGARSLLQGRPGLSPNLVALFGALLGLTTVGSLVALASHFDVPAEATAPQAAAPQEPAATEPAEPAPDNRPPRQKIPGPWRVADDAGKPGLRLLTGKIGTKAFLTAIQDAGLDKAQAYRAYTALKELTNLDRCSSSDEFAALVERASGKLVGFEYSPSKEEVYQAAPGQDGFLQGKKLDLHVGRNQVRRSLVYDGKSLAQSARLAGFDDGLEAVLGKALSGHMTLGELEAGDRLRIVLQEVTVLGEFSRYAGVEAVEVLRGADKPLRIYYYHHPSEGGYFDGTGKAPYEGGWRKPIPGAPVTSKFNMQRLHPVLKKVIPHTGTDFGAPMGEPIGSSAPGRVSFIGYAGPSGNLVKVDHGGGYETGYAHLSRYAEGLKVGDQVKRLQTIGYCGSTGRSTGPHLHFTVKKDGKYIDPESLNLDGMRVLPPSHRELFGEVKRKYDELLDAIALPEPLKAPPPAAPAPEAAPAGAAPADGASADPASEDPGLEDPGEAEPLAPPTAPAAPRGKAPPAGAKTATPSQPAKASGSSAIFLTDSELLKMQGLTHDGEVD
jgi:murein DD-endopeptidase MepM/ murein hydrolase activator NlpD